MRTGLGLRVAPSLLGLGLLAGMWSAAQPAAAQGPGGDGGAAVDAAEAVAADPEAPTVAASIDRTEAHVGDQLTLTVTAVARAAIAETVRLPAPGLGRFEVLDSSQADRDLGDGRRSRRFVLQVAGYELGELEIPSLSVEYQSPQGGLRTLHTAPIPVTLARVVDDPAAGLQPLARTREQLVEDRRPWQALLAAAAVLLALLLLGLLRALFLRRRQRAPVERPPVVRPADEVALERLAALRRRGQFGLGGYQPFHFELAEVVRGYLGARFGFDALELTTTELLDELVRSQEAQRQSPPTPGPATEAPPLEARPPLPPPLLDYDLERLRRFLEECDLVKFAKGSASDDSALGLLAIAEELVRSTTAIAAAATLGPASLSTVAPAAAAPSSHPPSRSARG